MNIIDSITQKAEFIGNILIEEDRLSFKTPHMKSSGQMNRAHFIDMGDIVYFMFDHNDQLLKIGKAAGLGGWYSRMGEYCKKRFTSTGKETWDATTRKIYNHMTNNYSKDKRYVKVLAIRTPRIHAVVGCPITSLPVDEYIETASKIEQNLIQLAYKEGCTLAFCREKDKGDNNA